MARRTPPSEPERDARTGRSAAHQRMAHQQQWVDEHLRIAQERGDFDNLPGFGKPLELSEHHDPDWWIKQLVERERISVLPPALALRREAAELDDLLDTLHTEKQVRAAVQEFNERVRAVLYSNPGGPPVVTSQRDVEHEVGRWRERLASRRTPPEATPPSPARRRWWQRRS